MKEPITEEEIKAFEQEYSRREEFLYNHGWHLVDNPVVEPTNKKTCSVKTWYDPVNNKMYPYAEGYDQLTMILLRGHGWKAITEVLHLGKKDSIKVETWGRFQSPFTNRIYSFLEAQHVMEQGWNEEFYPAECSEATRLRNRLVGDNFQGDTIETWYYQEKGKTVFRLWVDD